MQKQFFWIWNFSKKIFKTSILQLELNYACHKKSYCAHFRTRERMIKLQDHNILETSMIVINPRSLKIWRNVSFNYTSEYQSEMAIQDKKYKKKNTLKQRFAELFAPWPSNALDIMLSDEEKVSNNQKLSAELKNIISINNSCNKTGKIFSCPFYLQITVNTRVI